jgi:hypothetical protein
MRGQYLATVLVGVVIGSGATTLALRQPGALAQEKERKAGWEYKVVFSRAQEKDDDKAMTEQYAGLAKDGWEYVGPVVNRTQFGGPTGAAGVAGAYVLFRRSRL